MPFYYDLRRNGTTNGSGSTLSTHFVATTSSNQETVAISGLFVAARSSTVGGGALRLLHNTGTAASGGGSITPRPRNFGSPAAASQWLSDSAGAITAGGTLLERLAIGFAQTGGMGGWVAPEPSAAYQMKPNGANPVDMEVASITTATSVPIDITLEFTESR